MSDKQRKILETAIEAAREAREKTNVEHEQKLYDAIGAFFNEVLDEDAPPANTNTSSPS